MTQKDGQPKAASGPICFGVHNDLFGWLHAPQQCSGRPAIVICNPVGFEFIRSYRSLRVLAERLAATGYFVLRFDYRSTGDSAGDEFDQGRVAAMLGSIREAIAEITRLADTERVALVGFRLGATLAGSVAEERSLDQLVLWAPCDTGALYVREQQIIASAQKKHLDRVADGPQQLDGTDAGGFFLTRETQKELASLDLGSRSLKSAPPIMLLNRDDLPVAPRLAERLRGSGSDVDVVLSRNFREMMLAPQLAEIPTDAIDKICRWLEAHNGDSADQVRQQSVKTESLASKAVNVGNGAFEHPVHFGPEKRLFGIITATPGAAETTGPAVILLCGGATHRVSANRMYVSLARRLAANGTPVMRFDIAGIGDSSPHEGYPPNKPYTDRIADDVEAAMAALEEKTGRKSFLLFGLCSGAFAAMQTALRSPQITDLVLVNQLVYYVSPQDLEDLASGAMASAHELDFPRSKSLAYRVALYVLRHVSRWWSWPGERLSPLLLGGRLPHDLDKLAAQGIRLAFLHSSRDDAIDALLMTSGSHIRRLADSGLARVQVFEATDHTFSPRASQRALSDWLVDYVATVANS